MIPLMNIVGTGTIEIIGAISAFADKWGWAINIVLGYLIVKLSKLFIKDKDKQKRYEKVMKEVLAWMLREFKRLEGLQNVTSKDKMNQLIKDMQRELSKEALEFIKEKYPSLEEYAQLIYDQYFRQIKKTDQLITLVRGTVHDR